jgi:hypothetical protein
MSPLASLFGAAPIVPAPTLDDRVRASVAGMTPEERIRRYKLMHPGWVARTDLDVASGTRI